MSSTCKSVTNLCVKVTLSTKGELGGPWVIIALDGENAFGSMFRHHILDFIAEVCPHNYAFFELMYPPASSGRRTVTHFDGFSVNVERGIQQGAHSSPAIFCAVLGWLFKKHGIKEDHLSIADDLTIYCKLSSAIELLDKYEMAYEDMGSRFKRVKSKFLLLRGTTELTAGDQAILTALQSRGIPEADLIEIGGIPFSTDQALIADFVKAKFTDVCKRIGDVSSDLKSYSPLGALEIIKLCILPSVVHLMRSLPASVTLDLSWDIRQACYQAILNMIPASHPVVANAINMEGNKERIIHKMFQPERDGGLGLMNPTAVSIFGSISGLMASEKSLMRFLCKL